MRLAKYAFLAWFGGSTYVTLEVFWRARSHWTMFLMASFVFIILGLLNEVWKISLPSQIFIGTILATVIEFITGCIVNLALHWNVWDYSNLPFNFMGQICLYFTFLWIIVVTAAILLDDLIRWKFFDEDPPHWLSKR